MSNWIPSKKLFASVATAFVLSFIVYMIGLWLVTSRMEEVERFYSDAESGVTKTAKAEAIQSMAENNQAYIENLRSFFVQKGDEVQFIEHIEDLGRGSGVEFEIASIDVDPEEADVIKEDISLTINAEGLWLGVVGFIDKLEKARFGIEIREVQLEEISPDLWSGRIKLVVFREI